MNPTTNEIFLGDETVVVVVLRGTVVVVPGFTVLVVVVDVLDMVVVPAMGKLLRDESSTVTAPEDNDVV
jgi:hypothetical protein